MLRGVVYGGLGGVALGMVLAFTVAAILGTPTWILPILASVALTVTVLSWRYSLAQPKDVPGAVIEPDSVALPNGRTLHREDVAHLLPGSAGLVAIDGAGELHTIGTSNAPPAVWRAVIGSAWQLEPVSASEVESPPDWFERIDTAGVDRGRVRYAAAALWVGGLGISPRGVLVPGRSSWWRCHAELRPEGVYAAGSGQRIVVASRGDEVVALINEVSSPLRASVFGDRAWSHWRARTQGDRCVLAAVDGRGGIQLTARMVSWAGGEADAEFIAAIIHESGTSLVEIAVFGASDAMIPCASEAAAAELAMLLGVWHDPTRAPT